MSINFEYYKVFYYVANYHSITIAAQELSLTQPSVTRSIQTLESHLGCQLFTRSKKGVALTAEGKMIYQRILSACNLLFSAESEIEHMKSDSTGTVHIGTDDLNIRRDYLFSLLEKYRRLHPRVKLRIVQKDGMELIEALQTGILDLCFLANSAPGRGALDEATASAPTLEFRLVHEYMDVVIVGKELCHLYGHPVTLQEISVYPLIVWAPNTATRHYFEEIYRQQDLTLSPSYELTDIEFQILMTERGFGYSFVPLHCVEDKIRRGLLFPLELTGCSMRRQMLLVTDKARRLGSAAQSFLDLLEV